MFFTKNIDPPPAHSCSRNYLLPRQSIQTQAHAQAHALLCSDDMPNSETVNTIQSKPLDLGIPDFRNEARVIPTKKCTTPNETKSTENASTVPVEQTDMTDTTVLKQQLNFFNSIKPNEMDDN